MHTHIQIKKQSRLNEPPYSSKTGEEKYFKTLTKREVKPVPVFMVSSSLKHLAQTTACYLAIAALHVSSYRRASRLRASLGTIC